MMAIARLDPADYDELIRRALAEDVGAGDVTTRATVPGHARGSGVLLAKAPLIVAGLDVARAVFVAVAGEGSIGFTPRVSRWRRCGGWH